MATFKRKYRVDSTRLKGWDYASDGWYFVTICTKNRVDFLGTLVGEEMQLSPIGQIVAEEWQRTEEIRESVNLDEWVIMPNHLHGILVINGSMSRPGAETGRRPVSTEGAGAPSSAEAGSLVDSVTSESTALPVEAGRRPVSDDNRTKGELEELHRPVATNRGPGSLSTIIAQFKSVCTKRIWAAGRSDFAWQPRYYDHIIRNDRSLAGIRAYIRENPLKWHLDPENPARAR